jgi:hypothetical protein
MERTKFLRPDRWHPCLRISSEMKERARMPAYRTQGCVRSNRYGHQRFTADESFKLSNSAEAAHFKVG